MDQSKGWGRSRYLTLLVVMALHVALLAALLTSRTRILLSTGQPVELLYLTPANTPKVRAETFRPRRLSGDTAISIVPPIVDSAAFSLASAGSESDGGGSGVDWKAEARRAVQAFEIRKLQPRSALSGSPAEETWWPRVHHHPGDQYKTASGDWIVWINSRCYQVATSVAYAPGATLPQTICPRESSTPRAERPRAERDPARAQ